MNRIEIHGRVPLQGKVRVQGSKNAALPILAACLLIPEKTVLRNCPGISDVSAMISLLSELGMRIRRNGHTYTLEPENCGAPCRMMNSGEVRSMRSSLLLLGTLLAKWGRAEIAYPGGCVIGSRPIDLHLYALEQLGVSFEETEQHLIASVNELHGGTVRLPFASVGVTENLILVSMGVQGTVVIQNAAKEPEVAALCRFLTACGANIDGIGTGTLVIRGGSSLHGCVFRIPADRIVAGTYLLACVGTGGSVFLEEAPWREMQSVLELAQHFGATLCCTDEGIYCQGPEVICPVRVRTGVYPAFPTDLQSAALAVATLGRGQSRIEETIFENRFRVTEDLCRMGAELTQADAETVLADGVAGLHGALVRARELRGGAALVIAGLMARGTTVITNCEYIERGYENICRDFRELGASITCE